MYVHWGIVLLRKHKKFLNTADMVWIWQLGNCAGWISIYGYNETANTSEDWKVSRKINEGLRSERRNTKVTDGLICSEELRQRQTRGKLPCAMTHAWIGHLFEWTPCAPWHHFRAIPNMLHYPNSLWNTDFPERLHTNVSAQELFTFQPRRNLSLKHWRPRP